MKEQKPWIKWRIWIWIIPVLAVILFLWKSGVDDDPEVHALRSLKPKTSLDLTAAFNHINQVPSSLEQTLIDQGLMKVVDADSTIQEDLRYSSKNNFLGQDIYGRLESAYLQPEAVEKLAKAQAILRNKNADYSLLILDAVRPVWAQKKMWELVKGTEQQRYVADATSYSMHNYGMAVDITIVDSMGGDPLDMGTEFDYFGALAQPRHEMSFYQENKLTKTHLNNRWLLRNTMKEAGFIPILSEWWHFNANRKSYIRQSYSVIH